MAASVTVTDRGAAGDLFFRIVEVALDNSYPQGEGGYFVTPQQFGFGENGTVVMLLGGTTSDGLYELWWDEDTGAVRVFDRTTAAEVADDVDLSAYTGVRAMVWGIGQG